MGLSQTRQQRKSPREFGKSDGIFPPKLNHPRTSRRCVARSGASLRCPSSVGKSAGIFHRSRRDCPAEGEVERREVGSKIEGRGSILYLLSSILSSILDLRSSIFLPVRNDSQRHNH